LTLFQLTVIFCRTVTGTVFRGNTVGKHPYKSGESCQECPTGKTTCDNKLCRKLNAANFMCMSTVGYFLLIEGYV